MYLEVKDLKKSYGEGGGYVQVLKGITAGVEQGEMCVIQGTSGSGKSTLLRSLNLLEIPTAGSVFMEGMDITDRHADINLHRQKMGMVFQHFNLFPHMTVLRNMTLAPIKLKGKTREQAEEQAMELLGKVGLADRANAYPDQLSGGQKQRVAIVRALCMEPELLVADEPIASLDVSIQAQIVNLFRHLQREHGFSFLFIAHDLAMVEFLCDRVGVLYHGKLVEVAPVRALYDHPIHPYTKALLAAMPIPDPRIERKRVLPDFSPGQFPLTGELIEAEPDHFVLQEGGAR